MTTLSEISSVSPIPSLDVGAYRFRNFEEVSQFLATNSHLVELLRKAYPQIVRLFGAQAIINLEVVSDPEGRDLPELFALIQSPASAASALDKLNQFDEEWWLVAAASEDRLHFDVEYV